METNEIWRRVFTMLGITVVLAIGVAAIACIAAMILLHKDNALMTRFKHYLGDKLSHTSVGINWLQVQSASVRSAQRQWSRERPAWKRYHTAKAIRLWGESAMRQRLSAIDQHNHVLQHLLQKRAMSYDPQRWLYPPMFKLAGERKSLALVVNTVYAAFEMFKTRVGIAVYTGLRLDPARVLHAIIVDEASASEAVDFYRALAEFHQQKAARS